MKPYDLHNHTSLSPDGQISGRELIDLAISKQLKGIGICDHDIFPDETLYDYAKHKGIKLALGIEFTCNKSHIIGYNINIKGDDKTYLEQLFDQLKTAYVENCKKLIEALQERGINISYEKLQEFYNKDDITKIYVNKYLAEELKLFQSWADARRYHQREGIDFKATDDLNNFSSVDAINIIHRANGYAIWAHPFITTEDVRYEYFELFPQHNIDAIEAAYAYRENGYNGKETNEQLEILVREMLQQKSIPVSGGSDSHYPLKTYSDLKPIQPGDFGLTQEEFEAISFIVRQII